MKKNQNIESVLGNLLGNYLYDKVTHEKETLLKLILIKLYELEQKIDTIQKEIEK